MILYFSSIFYFFIKTLDIQLLIVFHNILLENHSKIFAMTRPEVCFVCFKKKLKDITIFKSYL